MYILMFSTFFVVFGWGNSHCSKKLLSRALYFYPGENAFGPTSTTGKLFLWQTHVVSVSGICLQVASALETFGISTWIDESFKFICRNSFIFLSQISFNTIVSLIYKFNFTSEYVEITMFEFLCQTIVSG